MGQRLLSKPTRAQLRSDCGVGRSRSLLCGWHGVLVGRSRASSALEVDDEPDIFITIAFAGIADLVPVVALLFVMPQIRRDEARLAHSESEMCRRPP